MEQKEAHNLPVRPDLARKTRQCAVMRAERALDGLIRFVAAPDGNIVPDLAQRLPGRGVWVTAERSAVAMAVRRHVFARSLKRRVVAAADLPDLVEGLLLKRAMNALSLANKAGLVVAGFVRVEAAIKKGEAALLIHGSDAADDGCVKLSRKYNAMHRARGTVPRIATGLTISQISLAIGRTSVVHAALTPGGATEKFLTEAKRLEQYRCGSSGLNGGDPGPSESTMVTTGDA